MATNRFLTSNDIINRVGAEVGLTPVQDVFGSGDPAFDQLTYLLTTCVQELMELFIWQILIREFQHTTVQGKSGDLDLPADFGYMIPQTGWERSENVPLIGPLSSQDWTYLLGRDLVSSTIYASFRFDQNKLRIFPNDPAPGGLNINFEYVSRNLIQLQGTDPIEYSDQTQTPSDIVLFPPHLITRMLRMKFLDAKGFDSVKATDDYNLALMSWQGKDNSAPILTTQRNGRWFPYLDTYRNTPDTKFGSF